ncbi:MAG: ABC-2 family transporter protein, partial [Deltaproteobacteria bacterium]|nr:ABC-2 family transporter protein [Deltaproteobacteria bacterium]
CFREAPNRGIQVLGLKLRQWWITARLTATGYVGDSPFFVVDYLLRALRVAVLLSIWRTVLEANPGASPLSLATLMTYTVISEAFVQLVVVRTSLAEAFWQGTLVHYFLRPIGLVWQVLAESSGRWVLDLVLFSLPLIGVAKLLGIRVAPVSAEAGALFVLSLALAVSVGLALEFITGALTLASDQPVWLVEWVRRALSILLSGAMIPLNLLPWGLGEIFAWLPFASMAWAPLAIHTGAGEALRLLGLQFVWAIVLWPIAIALWNANREKVVGYGG